MDGELGDASFSVAATRSARADRRASSSFATSLRRRSLRTDAGANRLCGSSSVRDASRQPVPPRRANAFSTAARVRSLWREGDSGVGRDSSAATAAEVDGVRALAVTPFSESDTVSSIGVPDSHDDGLNDGTGKRRFTSFDAEQYTASPGRISGAGEEASGAGMRISTSLPARTLKALERDMEVRISEMPKP